MLVYGQLIKAQLENSASDIASADGMIYYNTATLFPKYYNGSWRTFADTNSTQVFTGKDYDGGTASNTSRITVPKDTLANLTSLTRKAGTLVYATDTELFYGDDGTSLNALASSSITYLEATSTAQTNLGTSLADLNWNTLTLAAGTWQISYSLTGFIQTGSTASNATSARTVITDSSNNQITGSSRFGWAFTNTNAAMQTYFCLMASVVVTIGSTTTYKLRGYRVDNAGTGSSTIYETGDADYRQGLFWAIKLA